MIKNQNKKAAMEMSVGTIVTIVLLMSVLVLGLFFVQDIFEKGQGALDMTDNQLQDQISQIFKEEGMKSAIYPSSAEIQIKPGEIDAIGLGIKNIPDTTSSSNSFEYYTEFSSSSTNCNINRGTAEQMIILGGEAEMTITPNDLKSTRIKLQVPSTAIPDCIIRYQIKIYRDGDSNIYDSQFFDLTVK